MLVIISLSLLSLIQFCHAYSIGDVDPLALRGVWRLTSLDKDGLPFGRRHRLRHRCLSSLPMKEFTIYPKPKQEMLHHLPPPRKQTEIFIKLKDDKTFEQCTSLFVTDTTTDTLEEQLALEVFKRERESFAWRGIWEFVEGKLILAADRPEKRPFSLEDEQEGGRETWPVSNTDTILVGTLSVQTGESLEDNPQGLQDRSVQSSTNSIQEQPVPNLDVHLTVPRGKIKVGKFMYPKHHPSFFELPIVNPQSMGYFELKQILGDYNARLGRNFRDKESAIELFRKQDFLEKRFYLSISPLTRKKKKKNYASKDEEELKPQKNMQVVAVELFANNTFSTIYGLGSSTILRGKWSIIGDSRDQLWMMVYRFGFGRSVSYGTYSEGKSLTQDDDKGYWGKITEVKQFEDDNLNVNSTECGRRKIEVNGAVMVGWGLEPCSVGVFKMIEIEEEFEIEDEVDDDLDDDEISMDTRAVNASSFKYLFNDPANDETSEILDLPGSFE